MNEYRKRNKEKINEQKKKHYEKHRDYYLNYYATHREHIRELAKACYHRHKVAGKNFNTPKIAEFNKQYRLRVKSKLFDILGNKCARCGFSDIRALQIDHVHGGGTKHRKEIGNQIYSWLKRNNYPKGFQILCFNCNNGKKIKGVCPHLLTR